MCRLNRRPSVLCVSGERAGNEDTVFQGDEDRRLPPQAEAAWPQALSAGADAGTAVPLQSRLQSAAARSIIRIRSSIAGCRSRSASQRLTSAAPRWSRFPGGEPLIHKDIGAIVKGIVARKKFVSLCTNALLLEKKLDLFEPSPYLFFSVHLDGLKEHHDKSVSQEGVFDRAVSAIRAAKARGFAVNVNATIFDGHSAEDIAAFLDFAKSLGRRRLDLARLCLRAGARPGALPQPPQDQGAVPPGLRAGPRQGMEPDAFRPVPRFPRRQPDLPLHALGHADPQHFRLAEALLPARRRLCELLHGTDGDDRLGLLRHRPVRKMRELHGALRL